MINSKPKFSQRHPFIFGLFLIILAVVLIISTMAFFSYIKGKVSIPFLQSKKIGLVNISGTITDSRKYIDWIDKLKNDSHVVGVILRINSPGGVVAPSQEIYEAVASLDKVKPVVVSMGSVAASGAYYISCGARAIVANPGTITGSIGVIANLISIEDLLKKLGVEDQSIATGKFKMAGSPLKKLTEEQRRYLKGLIDNLYNQFIEAVVKGRKLEKKKVLSISDGRVFTGLQAKELGLVDYLGNMSKAIKILKKLCNTSEEIEIIEGPQKKEPLIKRILGAAKNSSPFNLSEGFYYMCPLYIK
ncbi:signal peptide peptidase SppA [Desulfothermus okinawensis JCM 13304]